MSSIRQITGNFTRNIPPGAPYFGVSDGGSGIPSKFPNPKPNRERHLVGCLIVEGAQHSGSAITARLAMDQGREVFAVPGNITSKMSWGPNLLVKQGAKLVQEWTDVTNELPAALRRDLVNRAQQKVLSEGGSPATLPLADGPEEPLKVLARKLLNQLQVDVPQQLESLVETFESFSSSELIGALFELEMSGLVRQLPGKSFVKVW